MLVTDPSHPMGPNNGFTCLTDISAAAMAHHHADFAAEERQKITVVSKKLPKTVKIGIATIVEIINELKYQMFIFLYI